MIAQDIAGYNQKLRQVSDKVTRTYQHDEEVYQICHQVVQMARPFCHASVETDKAILMLGQTGSGKSAFINWLHGVEMTTSNGRNLRAKRQNEAIALIGQGYTSTTFAPQLYETNFGKVYDLQWDREPREDFVEIIDCLSKKTMATHLKEVKFVMMISASTFGPGGAYGDAFKDILAAYDKFFKDINQYKDNTVIVISFAERNQEVQHFVDQIFRHLDHTDERLRKYKQLIQSVIENKRIKLFYKPSSEPGAYTVPAGVDQGQHEREAVRKQLVDMPFRKSTKDDFQVPYSIRTEMMMKKFYKVFVEKTKNTIENYIEKIYFSGVELRFAKNLLGLLNENMTLQQFSQLTSESSFLPDSLKSAHQTLEEYRQAQFVEQFISNDNQPIIENWVSDELQQRISQMRDQINLLIHEKGGDFRKRHQSDLLKLRFNLEVSLQIQELVKDLEGLYIKRELVISNRNNNTSEFYVPYMELVLDKVQNGNIQHIESYVSINSNLFRVQERKKFDEERYNYCLQSINDCIAEQTKELEELLRKSKQGLMIDQQFPCEQKFARNRHEENFENILQEWYQLECMAFRSTNPSKKFLP